MSSAENLQFPQPPLYPPEFDASALAPVSDEVFEPGFVPGSSRLAPTAERMSDLSLVRRIRQYAGRLGLALSVLTGGAVNAEALTATPAAADASWGTYQVANTSGEGLVLHANSPSGPQNEIMPDDTPVQVQCYELGATVNGNDPVWLQVVDSSTGLAGFAADAYVNTSWDANNTLADQGLAECGMATNSQSGNNSIQPAESVPVFTTLDRNTAAQWAIDHAELIPPSYGSCTWFVSQALWAGGMPQTSEWNGSWSDPHGLPTVVGGSGVREGTVDAWGAPNLVEYLSAMPYVTIEPLGTMNANNNDMLDARDGDIVAYIWTPPQGISDMPLSEQLTYINHLDLVTGSSSTDSEYPLVSGWSENGAQALNYDQRGWTWSDVDNTWLQNERDKNGNYPNKNMVAYLVHINSENDLNISN